MKRCSLMVFSGIYWLFLLFLLFLNILICILLNMFLAYFCWKRENEKAKRDDFPVSIASFCHWKYILLLVYTLTFISSSSFTLTYVFCYFVKKRRVFISRLRHYSLLNHIGSFDDLKLVQIYHSLISEPKLHYDLHHLV